MNQSLSSPGTHQNSSPMDGSLATMTPVVFFFPDYRSTNHYQDLFYKAARSKLNVRPGSLDEALAWQAETPPGCRGIFHLHWTAPILASSRDRESALHAKNLFLAKLRHFLAAGGSFIWTIHNVLPHDVKFEDVEVALAQEMVAIASRIVVHSRSALTLIAQKFAVPEEKVVILPHGHYVGVYPQETTREKARARFGYDAGSRVFLFLGQLRPYKGLDELFAAFAALRLENPDARLLVAGRPVHPLKHGQVKRQASIFPGIEVIEGHIPDAELQDYFVAADFAVLPYRNILTSGSALLACSFGVPCIAPAISMLPEVIDDGVDGFLYGEKGATHTLLDALRRAATLPDEALSAMKAATLSHVQRFNWERVGLDFAEAALHGPGEAHLHTIDVFGRKVAVHGRVHLPSAGKPDAVAAIVVNYGGTDDVSRLVSSLRATHTEALDVLIIDNASPGESANALMTRFPDCTVLRAQENLGFGGGNNIAIALALQCGYMWCWLVNPDLEVQTDTACKLLAAAKQTKGRAIVGPVIVYGHQPDTIAFAGGHIAFEDGMVSEYPLAGRSLEQAALSGLMPTDYVNGACLFAPAAAFREGGPLPEEYFLYFEETDWCARVRNAGFALHIVGEAVALHHKKSEGATLAAPYYLYYYLRSAVQFVREQAAQAVDATVRQLRAGFVDAWSAKIAKRAPFYSPIANALMEGGISDGIAGVKGRVELDDVIARYLPERTSMGAPVAGHFDRVADGILHAWAWRQGESDPHTSIGIFVDGKPEALVKADQPRNDLREAGIGDGTHGIRWAVPDRWRDGARHRFELRCPRTGARLAGTPAEIVVGLREFVAPPTPTTAPVPSGAALRGRIDGFSGDTVTGWAFNRNNPFSRVTVDLLWKGRVISRTVANLPRADLHAAGLGDGACAFVARVPVALLRQPKATLTLVISGTGTVLYEREMEVPRAPQLSMRDDSTLENFLRWSWVRTLLPTHAGNAYDQTMRRLEALRASLAERWRDRTSGCLVSIVLPVWNRAATLVHAIQSVSQQTWSDWELLIVDDDSTDASREIVQLEMERRGDPRIRFHALPENRGVSAARNHALSMAKGEVVAYLDSDNTWDPSMLQILVNLLLENPDRDCAYAGQSIWHYIDDGRAAPFSEAIGVRSVPYNRSLLENRNYIDLNVFIHRRTLYERLGGFNEKMTRLVDWELILRYTASCRPLFAPPPLCSYAVARTDNQITAVFDFDENHKYIVRTRENLRTAAPEVRKSVAAEPYPIDVVVMVTDSQAESHDAYWRFLLGSAVAGGGRVIIASSRPTSKLFQLRKEMALLKEVDFAYESGVPGSELMGLALEMRRPDADLVLMTSTALPAADWKQSLRRVLGALKPYSMVTGRWIYAHDNPALADERFTWGRGDVDIMPARVAERVVDFEPVPGDAAIAISGMPLFFCGMGSQLASLLRGAARMPGTGDEVLQFFCDALRQVGGKAYYSSDLVVYDRSYLG